MWGEGGRMGDLKASKRVVREGGVVVTTADYFLKRIIMQQEGIS